MKVTKLGHCALVIETDGAKILTDPGNYTAEAQEKLTGLDAIVITHEHQDHYYIDSIKKLTATNPGISIISNSAVAKLLAAEGVACTVAGDGESAAVKGLAVKGYGRDHAPIYNDFGLVENTGYMIADKFYFPGDNFHIPGVPVDVLALPCAGPWMKMSDALDFANSVKARAAFGVHDGMIQPASRGFFAMAMKMFVKGTEYTVLADGEGKEF